jgi:two-component system, response regulator FlrC
MHSHLDGFPQDATILLVEDDLELREATLELIELFGHSAVSVETVPEARQLLASRSFRLLVSDVRLNGDSGVALACFARQQQPNIALLLLSGDDLPEDGPQLPSDAAFLRKPYEFDEFEDLLTALS